MGQVPQFRNIVRIGFREPAQFPIRALTTQGKQSVPRASRPHSSPRSASVPLANGTPAVHLPTVWGDFALIASEELWERLTPELACPDTIANYFTDALGKGRKRKRHPVAKHSAVSCSCGFFFRPIFCRCKTRLSRLTIKALTQTSTPPTAPAPA
ncbi:MAG: hypothetical protein ABSE73_15605 [Planctomycetota bacterium]